MKCAIIITQGALAVANLKVIANVIMPVDVVNYTWLKTVIAEVIWGYWTTEQNMYVLDADDVGSVLIPNGI